MVRPHLPQFEQMAIVWPLTPPNFPFLHSVFMVPRFFVRRSSPWLGLKEGRVIYERRLKAKVQPLLFVSQSVASPLIGGLLLPLEKV